MSTYLLYGNGNKLFDVLSGDDGAKWSDILLYVTPTEFGITNTDGTQTFFQGTGIVWDAASGQFLGGTVTRVVHFANGNYVDELNNIRLTPFGDTLFGYTFANFFSGDDILDARFRVDSSLSATLNGLGGNDTIYGGLGSDFLFGGDGNDTIIGGGGNDFFDGGTGDDQMTGGSGNDRFFAGAGADRVDGGAGVDRMSGGADADTLNGGAGNDVLYGGQGSDAINGGAGTDTAVFNFSRSELRFEKTATGFRILGVDGIDTLTGIERLGLDDGTYSWNAAANNWLKINTNAGVALVNPQGVVTGTSGADEIGALASDRPAVVRGLEGDDQITTNNDDTLIFGGAGNDKITTFANFTGIQRVYGEAGDDTILLSGDRSVAYGGAGNDIMGGVGRLIGGYGNDVISGSSTTFAWGGNGDDVLRNAKTATGNAGADTFDFSFVVFGLPGIPSVSGWGDSTVTDFELGVDKLVVSAPSPIASSLVLDFAIGADGYILTATAGGRTSTVSFFGLTTPGLTIDDLTIV